MEYLNRVLGIRVVYQTDEPKPLPDLIQSEYRLQMVTLEGKDAVFLYPKAELDAMSAVARDVETVQKAEGVPAVLVTDRLTFRQREYFLHERIPFVVEGKQLYLPFMAVFLQEKFSEDVSDLESILPSSQLLLFYYIYHGCGELLTSEASARLGLTATTISRASRQLESVGLVRGRRNGVQKIISSDKTPEELFHSAGKFLCDPVRRTVYVAKERVTDSLLMGGYSALSEYTPIQPPPVLCLASHHTTLWDGLASEDPTADGQIAMELWRYDPGKLSQGKSVDQLSLAVSLRQNQGRVQEAVAEMLEQVWRDIRDGKALRDHIGDIDSPYVPLRSVARRAARHSE